MNRKVLIYKINYNSSLIQYGAGKKEVTFVEFKLDDAMNPKKKKIALESSTDAYELDYIKQIFFYYFRIPIKSRNNLIKILHDGEDIINEDSVKVDENKQIVFVMKKIRIKLKFKNLIDEIFELEFFSFDDIKFVKKMVIDSLVRSKGPLENDIELYFKKKKLNERERINSTELMNNPIINIYFKISTSRLSETINEKERNFIDLKQRYDPLIKEINKNIDELTDQIEKLRQEINKTEGEREINTNEKNKLESQLDDLEKQHSKLFEKYLKDNGPIDHSILKRINEINLQIEKMHNKIMGNYDEIGNISLKISKIDKQINDKLVEINMMISELNFRNQLIVNSTFFKNIPMNSPQTLVKLPDSNDVNELIPIADYESALKPFQYFGISQSPIDPLERTEQRSSTSLVNVIETLESSVSEIKVNDPVNQIYSEILTFLKGRPNLLVNTSETSKQYLNYLGKINLINSTNIYVSPIVILSTLNGFGFTIYLDKKGIPRYHSSYHWADNFEFDNILDLSTGNKIIIDESIKEIINQNLTKILENLQVFVDFANRNPNLFIFNSPQPVIAI